MSRPYTIARMTIAVVLCLFIATLTAKHVLAAGGGTNITTTPVYTTLSTKPGTTATTIMHVMNNGTKPQPMTVHLNKFSAYGGSGQAAIAAPAAGDTSASWVHFSPASFVAQPGVWNTVTMTINVPKTATLGYYYAVLFSPDLDTSTPITGGTNKVSGTNAVLVLLDTQSANEHRQLQVANFSTSKKVYEYLPSTFTVTVHNSGNIYLPPQGDVYISRSPSGNPIATLDVNSAQGNILPNSNRIFQVQWNDGFPSYQQKRINGQIVSNNKGTPLQQLVWDFSKPLSKFRFGRYYARLVLVYNNGKQDIPINAVVSFWVIPWKLMLGVLFVIILLILALRYTKKAVKALWAKVHRGTKHPGDYHRK